MNMGWAMLHTMAGCHQLQAWGRSVKAQGTLRPAAACQPPYKAHLLKEPGAECDLGEARFEELRGGDNGGHQANEK